MTLSTVNTVFKCYVVQQTCVKKNKTCLENVCLQGYKIDLDCLGVNSEYYWKIS